MKIAGFFVNGPQESGQARFRGYNTSSGLAVERAVVWKILIEWNLLDKPAIDGNDSLILAGQARL